MSRTLPEDKTLSATDLTARSPLPMWVIHRETQRLLYANASALQQYGYTREEFLALSLTDLVMRQDGAPAIGDEPIGIDQIHIQKSGTEFMARVFAHAVDFEGEPAWFAAIDDITERVQKREELAWLAHHDPLTTLPRRSLLNERLFQAMADADRQGHRVGVLCMDLDRFKQVNDRLGHAGGDEVLRQVSNLLCARLRGMDTVARTGGDEFTILLKELSDRASALRVGEMLLRAMIKPLEIDGQMVEVSASFGASLYPDDGREPEDLLHSADSAMYLAKRAGGRRILMTSPDLLLLPAASAAIEAEMIRMLHEGGFDLAYQPKFRIDGSIDGFEALMRMTSPTLGTIGPDQFIPIAEDTGLIEPMERWVIQRACEQLREWQVQFGTAARMAVNVSPRQFRRRSFADEVLRIVRATGVNPACLEMEITERIVVRFDEVAEPMKKLSAAGITFAVDDFGTGYSSLQHLHRLPLATMKIDRSFVQRLAEPGTYAIVQAMVSMGKSLHMHVVAEGVETQSQQDMVVILGCDSVQGYLHSRPLPAAKVAEMLESMAK